MEEPIHRQIQITLTPAQCQLAAELVRKELAPRSSVRPEETPESTPDSREILQQLLAIFQQDEEVINAQPTLPNYEEVSTSPNYGEVPNINSQAPGQAPANSNELSMRWTIGQQPQYQLHLCQNGTTQTSEYAGKNAIDEIRQELLTQTSQQWRILPATKERIVYISGHINKDPETHPLVKLLCPILKQKYNIVIKREPGKSDETSIKPPYPLLFLYMMPPSRYPRENDIRRWSKETMTRTGGNTVWLFVTKQTANTSKENYQIATDNAKACASILDRRQNLMPNSGTNWNDTEHRNTKYLHIEYSTDDIYNLTHVKRLATEIFSMYTSVHCQPRPNTVTPSPSIDLNITWNAATPPNYTLSIYSYAVKSNPVETVNSSSAYEVASRMRLFFQHPDRKDVTPPGILQRCDNRRAYVMGGANTPLITIIETTMLARYNINLIAITDDEDPPSQQPLFFVRTIYRSINIKYLNTKITTTQEKSGGHCVLITETNTSSQVSTLRADQIPASGTNMSSQIEKRHKILSITYEGSGYKKPKTYKREDIDKLCKKIYDCCYEVYDADEFSRVENPSQGPRI